MTSARQTVPCLAVLPALSHLPEQDRRPIEAIRDHARETGQWPGVASLGRQLGVDEGEMRALPWRMGADLVVPTGSRLAITLKAALICANSEEERLLTELWLRRTAELRAQRPEGPRLHLGEVLAAAAMTTQCARRSFNLLVRTTELGTPTLPCWQEPLPTPAWYRVGGVETVRDLLTRAVPATKPVLGLDVEGIASWLGELERSVELGTVDRRRVAWLHQEVLQSPELRHDWRPMVHTVLGWSTELVEPLLTADQVAELRACFETTEEPPRRPSESTVREVSPTPPRARKDGLSDDVPLVVLPEARLEDIELVVTDIELRVRGPHFERAVGYEELRLVGRGNRAPGVGWELLRRFAANDGVVPTDSERLSAQQRNTLAQHVRDLRKSLGQLLGVSDGQRLIKHVGDGYRMGVRLRVDDIDDRPQGGSPPAVNSSMP